MIFRKKIATFFDFLLAFFFLPLKNGTRSLYASVLLLVVMAAVSALTLKLAFDTQNSLQHTGQVLLALEDVFGSLRDAETGQRGYIITGETKFLQPYRMARTEGPGRFTRLRDLLEDDPEQKQRLNVLEAEQRDWLEHLQAGVDLREVSSVQAVNWVTTERGKEIMDNIRALVREMRLVEEQRLANRSAWAGAAATLSFLIISGGSLLVAVLLYRAIQSVQAEMRQRQEAEAQVRLSEQNLSVTLQSIGDGVIATDNRGNVTFLNPVAQALTGRTLEEAKGQPIQSVFPIIQEITREETPNPITEALATGQIVELSDNTLLIAQDGTEIPVDDSAAPIRDAEGNILGGILVFRDISARQQARRELEQANVRLRRAMSETHHRVKNNLQTIAALVEMQALDGREMIPVSTLTRIHQHITALASIHDILTHEAKKDGDVVVLHTGQVLGKLRPLLESVSGNRRLNFLVEDVALPIRQGTSLAVLVNELVSNAVKHGAGTIDLSLTVSRPRLEPSDSTTGTSGDLVFSAGDPALRSTKTGTIACLQVRDNGPGFPPGFDGTRAANTGLELIYSLGHWDLNGEIEFGNHPEGGACVTITFPVNPALERSAPDLTPVAVPSR